MISGNRGVGFPRGLCSLIKGSGLWESSVSRYWGAWLVLSCSLSTLSSAWRVAIVAVTSRWERLDCWERPERPERLERPEWSDEGPTGGSVG